MKTTYKIIPLTRTEDIEAMWRIMKTVRHPRYTKTAFLENVKKGGFNALIKDENGRIKAAWLSRGVNIDGKDGGFIELVYHDGSFAGKRAFFFLAKCFFAALKDGLPAWYYTKKNIWRGSRPAVDGYYEFDRSRFKWEE